MRFKNLTQEVTQETWMKWKCLIREALDEFNEDVFLGKGVVRENNHDEKFYLLLETSSKCMYIFPIPGNALVFGLYHHKIQKEQLKLKSSANQQDEENLIGWFGLDVWGIESHRKANKVFFQDYIKTTLRKLYRNYWAKLLFG